MHSKPTCIIKHVIVNNCLFLEVFVTNVNMLFRTSPLAGDTVKYKPFFIIIVLYYIII